MTLYINAIIEKNKLYVTFEEKNYLVSLFDNKIRFFLNWSVGKISTERLEYINSLVPLFEKELEVIKKKSL
jgi:hypothetical protein